MVADAPEDRPPIAIAEGGTEIVRVYDTRFHPASDVPDGVTVIAVIASGEREANPHRRIQVPATFTRAVN